MAARKQTTKPTEFLRSPEAFPERPERIEVRETHISWVYLTDRFAYKLKKPVCFEFLDFSTAALRKHACEQELQLNRRLAPDVYLSVVPVRQTSGGALNLGGAKGSAVDWVVKMRRLDKAHTLESILSHRDLTRLELDSLAQRLAKFYIEQAPVTTRTEDFREALWKHLAANRKDLLHSFPAGGETIQRTQAAQHRYLRLMGDEFDHRVCDGRVVDGHGDLRPDHIYLEQSPIIIDCIEFNAEYRRNDIVDELGFLAMECDRLGARDVGRHVLRAYYAASDDNPSNGLVAFYKAYRASVRAKVTALRSLQQQHAARQASRRQVESYLRLATEYTLDLGPRMVLLVGGLMGSGKSTLASRLAEEISASLLQTDVLRRKTFSAVESPDADRYTPANRKQIYQDMCEQIGPRLTVSPTVILDGTFISQANRRVALQQARRTGAAVLQIECQCPRDVALQRIAERMLDGDSTSEARPDLYDPQAAEQQPPLDELPLFRLDTTQSLATQTTEALSFVRQHFRGE